MILVIVAGSPISLLPQRERAQHNVLVCGDILPKHCLVQTFTSLDMRPTANDLREQIFEADANLCDTSR
jgi:hypothetical protein